MNQFITGDTHRNFDKIEEYINDFFPVSSNLIILGDAGINYFLDESDNELKKRLNNLKQNKIKWIQRILTSNYQYFTIKAIVQSILMDCRYFLGTLDCNIINYIINSI